MTKRKLTKEQVEERRRLLDIPIDFEALVEDGVLGHAGGFYTVLDAARVPDHLWLQIDVVKENAASLISFRAPGRALRRE